MASFQQYLRQSTNIGMTNPTLVRRIAHEGLTSFQSLLDFDKKSIEALQKACKDTVPEIEADIENGVAGQAEITGVSIPSKCILRLIEACYAAHYYNSIGRTLNAQSLHYDNVLVHFRVERKALDAMKEDQVEPKVPMVNDKDGDRRIINWIPAFQDHCLMCYGALGPLAYIIRETSDVIPEDQDPLAPNCYFGLSGSLVQELVTRIPHTGPIYKSDNSRVFIKISEAVKGTTCESTVKAFARTKNGRKAYLALIANHAGEIKYRSLYK